MDNCQESSLANSEVCQSCANCCKVLRIWVRDCEGIFERLQLLNTDLFSVKKVRMEPYGQDIVFIDINIPCSQLAEENGKYHCKIWDSPEKPEMCRLYPSNQFISLDTKQMVEHPRLIEKIIESGQDLCPILEDLNVDEVKNDQQKMKSECAQRSALVKIQDR